MFHGNDNTTLQTPLLPDHQPPNHQEPLHSSNDEDQPSIIVRRENRHAREDKNDLNKESSTAAGQQQKQRHPPRAIPESLQTILASHNDDTTWQAFWNNVEKITSTYRVITLQFFKHVEQGTAYYVLVWMVVLFMSMVGGHVYYGYTGESFFLVLSGGPCILFVAMSMCILWYKQEKKKMFRAIHSLCKHYTKNNFAGQLTLTFHVVDQPCWLIRVSSQDGRLVEEFQLFPQRGKQPSVALPAAPAVDAPTIFVISVDGKEEGVCEEDTWKSMEACNYYYYCHHEESDGVHVFRLQSYLMESTSALPPLPSSLEGTVSISKWREVWSELTLRFQHRQSWVMWWTAFWVGMIHACLGMVATLLVQFALDKFFMPVFLYILPALVVSAVCLFCALLPRIFWPTCDLKAVHEYGRQQQEQQGNEIRMRRFQMEIIFYDIENLVNRLQQKWRTIQAKKQHCFLYFWQEEFDCEIRFSPVSSSVR